MKKIFLFCLCGILCSTVVFSQAKPKLKKGPRLENQIKQYWFVLIKTGPNTEADSTSKKILLQKHMANINKLYYDGILKVAGPFGENENHWEGLFVFDCATKEEAENYVQTDPAIAAGLFTVDVVPWYTAPIGSFVKGKPHH